MNQWLAEVLTNAGTVAQAYSASGFAQGPSMPDVSTSAPDTELAILPVTSGFQTIMNPYAGGGAFAPRLRTYDLRGGVVNDAPVDARSIAPMPGGGSVAVLLAAPPATGVSLAWLDGAGQVTRTVPLDNDVYRVLVSWDTGHLFAFVGGLPNRPAQGRWYDAAGAPLTAWFPLAIDKGSGGYQRLLADGVIAIAGSGAWVTAVRDGFEGTVPVPAWLSARPGTRLVTIRDGRGFAVLPSSGIGSFEVVTTSGESCGTVTLPPAPAELGPLPAYPPPRLDVGWDGTVIESIFTPTGEFVGVCTLQWWPGLLR